MDNIFIERLWCSLKHDDKRREEKRHALERWGAALERIVNPPPDAAKVVKLRSRG